eukprot:IDg10018t1
MCDSSFPAGMVVWARNKDYENAWFPARVLDPAEISDLDPSSIWTFSEDEHRMVHFFKDNAKIEIVEKRNLREYTSNIALLNDAGPHSGIVFVACQDANYWIRQSGIEMQVKHITADPMFLVNAIEYT